MEQGPLLSQGLEVGPEARREARRMGGEADKPAARARQEVEGVPSRLTVF